MKFRVETDSNSKDFIRLKDKESVTGVCAGEIYEYRQHWTGKQSEPCIGAGCVHCGLGKKASFKFRVNFLVNEGGQYVAKIFEQGWGVYTALRELNEEYELESHVIKITRRGAGMNDTEYSVVPVKNGILSAEKKEELSHIPLKDLQAVDKAKAEASAPPAAPHFNEDEVIPF